MFQKLRSNFKPLMLVVWTIGIAAFAGSNATLSLVSYGALVLTVASVLEDYRIGRMHHG